MVPTTDIFRGGVGAMIVRFQSVQLINSPNSLGVHHERIPAQAPQMGPVGDLGRCVVLIRRRSRDTVKLSPKCSSFRDGACKPKLCFMPPGQLTVGPVE